MKPERPERKAPSSRSWGRRLLAWAVFAGLLLAAWYFFRDDFLLLLQRNETLWQVYLHISHHIGNHTLLGLAYAGFFGSFFFIFIPLEPLYLYYLSLDHPAIFVTIIMIVSSIAGLVFDYGFGRLAGRWLFYRKNKEKIEKIEKRAERFGGLFLLLSNIVPFLPVQWICVFYGAFRYNFRKFMIYTFLGRSAYILFLWYASFHMKRFLEYFM